MSIHIKTGNIFFDNIDSGKSIFDFFTAQYDCNKKLLQISLAFSADYDAYVSEYLTTIKNINDNKYNMLTNKNFKFLFYNFS